MKTDVLIVGAGPAGLGAAVSAARQGAKVILLDENDRPGGQLYKQIHKFFGSKDHYAGMRGFQIADILLRGAEKYKAEIILNSQVLGLMDSGEVSFLRDGKLETIYAEKIVLATGAKENALMFRGWTLPGVMTAGAAQTFSNVHGILAGKSILIIGSGNVGLIVSYQLTQAGADVKAMIEILPNISGYQVHAAKIERLGIPIHLSHAVLEVRGNERVEEAIIVKVDESFKPIPGTEKAIPVDTVLLSAGLTPRIELSSMFNCKTAYESALGGIMPLHDSNMRSSEPNIYVCGDIAGVEEANTALDEGRLAGIHASLSLGYSENGAENELKSLQKSLHDLRSGNRTKNRLSSKERIIGKGAICNG